MGPGIDSAGCGCDEPRQPFHHHPCRRFQRTSRIAARVMFLPRDVDTMMVYPLVPVITMTTTLYASAAYLRNSRRQSGYMVQQVFASGCGSR